MGATMFGGSVFAEVSDQEFKEVRQGVNSNTQRISLLESAQKDAKDYSKDIAANKTAIADETTARKELDTRITSVKEYLENQTAANYVSKTDAAVQDGAVAKAGNTIGQNVTNLDGALAKETAARIGADKAQDKVIEQVNKNVADGFDTINKNVAAGFTALNQADANEATERKDADSQLNTKMTKGFATIQGQQDAQDAKIDKNHTDIQTNAGNIQKNGDAIKANSDRLDNHEGRIAGNETNIATNATNISKEISDRQDADTALQKNIDKEAAARGDKDKEHDTAIAANKKAIGEEAAARQADISRLDNKIHDVSKEVDTVGALSMAMSGLHPLSYDEGDARFQLSAAVGTYDGTEALALGGFYHFNRDSMLSVGVATDLGADEHRMGANVGYTRRIGQGGHVSRPSEGTVSDIMKDIKNLEQKQAKLEQENEQLKQQLAALKK